MGVSVVDQLSQGRYSQLKTPSGLAYNKTNIKILPAPRNMNALKHGLGVFLVIVSYTLVLTNAKYMPMEFSIESPDYERILRSDSGFSRILRRHLKPIRFGRSGRSAFRSMSDDGGDDEEISEGIITSDPDSKRSFEPASFSRILRNSFSRILKRDPSSFSRILKRAENSPSFSRILRTSGFSRILRSPEYQRNMRAQQFSRILKRVEPDMDHDFNRDTRSSGFSRIL